MPLDFNEKIGNIYLQLYPNSEQHTKGQRENLKKNISEKIVSSIFVAKGFKDVEIGGNLFIK